MTTICFSECSGGPRPVKRLFARTRRIGSESGTTLDASQKQRTRPYSSYPKSWLAPAQRLRSAHALDVRALHMRTSMPAAHGFGASLAGFSAGNVRYTLRRIALPVRTNSVSRLSQTELDS